MEDIEKLYITLKKSNLYSNSFKEFVELYQDDEYKKQVHDVIVDKGLYTNDFNTFTSDYALPVIVEEAETPSKIEESIEENEKTKTEELGFFDQVINNIYQNTPLKPNTKFSFKEYFDSYKDNLQKAVEKVEVITSNPVDIKTQLDEDLSNNISSETLSTIENYIENTPFGNIQILKYATEGGEVPKGLENIDTKELKTYYDITSKSEKKGKKATITSNSLADAGMFDLKEQLVGKSNPTVNGIGIHDHLLANKAEDRDVLNEIFTNTNIDTRDKYRELNSYLKEAYPDYTFKHVHTSASSSYARAGNPYESITMIAPNGEEKLIMGERNIKGRTIETIPSMVKTNIIDFVDKHGININKYKIKGATIDREIEKMDKQIQLSPEQLAKVNAPVSFDAIYTTNVRFVGAGRDAEKIETTSVSFPHQKELTDAEKILNKNIAAQNQFLPEGEKLPNATEDEIKQKARELVRYNRKTDLQEDNFTKELEENEELKGKYQYLARYKKDKNYLKVVAGQEMLNNMLNKDQAAVEKRIDQILLTEKTFFDSNSNDFVEYINPELKNKIRNGYTPINGVDYVQLENGTQVDITIWNEYLKNVNDQNTYVEEVKTLNTQIQDNISKLDDTDIQLRLLGKNYDTFQKFGAGLKVNTARLFHTFGYYVGKVVKYGLEGAETVLKENAIAPDFIVKNQLSKDLNNWLMSEDKNFNKWSGEVMSKYAKDVKFENAFTSIDNFGRFAVQELYTQAPIYGSFLVGGVYGAGFLSVSTAGGKLGELDQEDLASGKYRSEWEKFLVSNAYGGAELLGSLPSLAVLKTGKSFFAKIASQERRFNQSIFSTIKSEIPKAVGEISIDLAGESATQVIQNGIDGNPNTFEGVGHAMFTSGLFGVSSVAIPTTAGLALHYFQNKPNYDEHTQLNLQIAGINETLYKTPGLKPETRRALVEEKKQLEQKAIENIKEIENLVLNNMSKSAFQKYQYAVSKQTKINKRAQEIINDKSISKSERQRLLKIEKQNFDNITYEMDLFKNHKSFGNTFALLKHGLVEDQQTYNRLMSEAETLLRKEKNLAPDVYFTTEELTNKAYDLYLKENIINKAKSAKKSNGITIEVAETNKEARDLINKAENLSDKDKSDILIKIDNGTLNGLDNIDGKSFIFMENAVANGRTSTIVHETGHQVFRKIFGEGQADFQPMVQTISSWLESTDPEMLNVIRLKQTKSDNAKINAEEFVAEFLEQIDQGNIDFENTDNRRLASLFGLVATDIMSKNGGFDLEIKGEADAVNFLVNLAAKIRTGTLTETDIQAAKESDVIKGIQTDVESKTGVKTSLESRTDETSGEKQKRQDKRNTDVAEIYDEYAEGKTNKEWREFLDTPRGSRVLGNMINMYYPDMIASAIKNKAPEPLEVASESIEPLIKHIKAFNPQQNTDLAGYVGGYLGLKVGTGAKRVAAKTPTISMEKEGVREVAEKQSVEETTTKETKPVREGIKLADRLGDDAKKISEKVKKMKPVLEGKTYKTLKDLAPDDTQRMFGITPKPGNLSKADVKNAQAFIRKNADILLAMLPEGTTVGGKATGVQKVLLDAFYTKGRRVKAAKTGSTQGLATQTKKPDIKISEFLEVFGITPAGQPNVSDRNTSSRIKALVDQTGKLLTNQAIREVTPDAPKEIAEGKSRVMFSEDKFENETNWKTIPQKLGLDAIKTNTLQGKQEAIDVLFFGNESLGLEPIVREFPKSFIIDNIGTFSNGGVNVSIKDSEGNKKQFTKNGKKIDLREYTLKDGTTIRNNNPKFDSKEIQLQVKPVGNFLFANKLQVLDAIDKTEKLANEEGVNAFAAEDSKVAKAIKRQSYKNLESDMKKSSFKEDQKEARQGFKEILSIFNELIQSNPQYAPAIVALMSSTSGGQGHFMRKGSIAEFFNTLNTINVEEHTSPASDLAKFLVNRMVDGNFDEYVDAALDGYFQGSLPRVFDLMLKGDGFNYIKNIPKEYRFDVLTGLKSVWIRYFNPKVNAQVRYDKKTKKYYKGIDPNVIILSNGKSIAENFGLKVDSKFLNPEVIAFQQKLLFEIFNGDITQAVAKQRLQKALPVEMSKNKTNKKVDIPLVNESGVVKASEDMSMEDVLNKAASLDEALRNARNPKAPVKKIRVFDFDDTLARTKSNVLYTMPDGTTGKLTAEEFAQRGDEMLAEGAVWDFSEFNKVMDGKKGPLFEVAKKIQDARGSEDIFVLTARAPEASPAIKEFLDAIGLNLPIENISGLGDSSPFAKSNWIVDKAAEGYNDFYFADDHMANVKAVRDALEVLDVKSKTQQAKIKFSEDMNMDFNTILEESKGVDRFKVFSDVKAKIRGARARRQRFFIPPSAEDFQGLLYPTLGKGSQGERHLEFYDKALFKPYAQAMENLATDRNNLMQDFKALKKDLDVPKDLRKQTKSGFTNEQAVRVYLWNKTGQEIPGISKTDLKELTDIIENDPKLKVFADQILSITKGDGYSKPGRSWQAGTITTDLIQILNETKRAKYLETWQENVDIIFSKDNMNKLEAIFGPKYVEALKHSLARMKVGRNRIEGGNRLSNRVLDYINNSTGAIMFFNMRSALLQTISAANFINWSFNNPAKAGIAFANQPQYWKDFVKLMNSDYLTDRRNGLKLNINESEIADAAKTSKNKAKAVVSYIIEKGYIPTKFADSFAIATGGATFYRNRINDLIKNEGLSEAAAEKQAMQEFRKTSEISQQSSDPSKISQQQSTDLGRIILQFVNTPMQYARIQKRAVQDLANRRGDDKTNLSKIAYYGIMQNLMFNALQSGLFALGFGDFGEEEENKKIIDVANGGVDSLLRGIGFAGITVQTLKNLGIDIFRRTKKDRPEYGDAWMKLLDFSPAIKSKVSKLRQAAYPFDSKKRRQEVFDKGFSLDNPAYESLAKVITAATNIPIDRLFSKVNNIKGALDEENETWQSIAMVLGWPEWQIKPKEKPLTEEQKKVRNEANKVQRKKDAYKAAKGSTDYDTLKKLDSAQQIKMLKGLGYGEYTIKKAKSEKEKIDLIIHKNSGGKIKVNKKEQDEAKYKALKKDEQVAKLDSLGLSKDEIKALKYEKDRVKKLLELMEK